MARKKHETQDHFGGMRPPSQRQLRVGEELRHRLAELLRPGELRDPALHDANVTVTEVRLSPDLRNATAFVMPLGGANAEEIIAGLRRSASLPNNFPAGSIRSLRSSATWFCRAATSR